jgi:hypothetical protein
MFVVPLATTGSVAFRQILVIASLTAMETILLFMTVESLSTC